VLAAPNDYEALYHARILGVLRSADTVDRRLADRNFELLKDDSGHPSLHFKKAGAFWSARVGIQFRALSIKDDQGDMV
jgi:hypothetical protein